MISPDDDTKTGKKTAALVVPISSAPKDKESAQTDTPTSRRSPMQWDDLEGRDPPPRDWIIPHWIPAGHTTVIYGRGGIGKTLLAQHIGTALALGHEYIQPLVPKRVLMWAGEDDEDELWRRQLQILSWLGPSLSALTEKFYLHSYAGADITLMAPIFGDLTPTPMLTELREQVADYRAEVVVLDNIARTYGGNENDRHGVTTFCAMVQGACAPAAVIHLGHPAKVASSEYSGSTAWDGAVRSRLLFSDRPPGQDTDKDVPIDDEVKYLSRRKANYSATDICKFNLLDGVVLIPCAVDPTKTGRISAEFAKDIVRRAVKTLAARGLYGTASTASSNYLPLLAQQYGLLDTIDKGAFASAMRKMIIDGNIESQVVGKDSGRHPKPGLVVI